MGALFVIALMFHVRQQVYEDWSITHTIEYYSEVNRDRYVIHKTTCSTLNIILVERKQVI